MDQDAEAPASAPGLSTPEKTAGILSLVAATIHGIATPGHLEEWWGYGLFFAVTAVAQALFGIALLTRAINARDFGPRWIPAKHRLFLAGALGNALVIILWTITRTWGIPAGPEFGEREPIGVLDLVSKVVEGILVGLLITMAVLLKKQQNLAPLK